MSAPLFPSVMPGLSLFLPRTCVICSAPLSLAGALRSVPLCEACDRELVGLPAPRCPLCGRPIAGLAGPCLDCRRWPHAFDEAFPLFDFHGGAGILIAAFKFGGRRSLASWFALRLGAAISERWPDRVIVPVPPRKAVVAERGWDHVALVAKGLRTMGFRIANPLCRAPSLQQKHLGLAERRSNAARAYALAPEANVPAEIVLLDDVFTSGSTADACSRALKGGGARAVAFVAIAAD